MKKLLWWATWSTYEEEFHDQLKDMGVLSEQVVKDLVWYPVQHWCRAYFDSLQKFFKSNGDQGYGVVEGEDTYMVHIGRKKCTCRTWDLTVADTDGDESEKDEQPTIKPKRISEAKTRLEAKKVSRRPTGTRKIGFKGDENGVSIPTNILYSPKMLTYKGNTAMTLNQLNVEKEKNRQTEDKEVWQEIGKPKIAAAGENFDLKLTSIDAVFFGSSCWGLIAQRSSPFSVEFSPFDGELRRRRHCRKSQTVALRSNANVRCLRHCFMGIFIWLGSRSLGACFGTGPPSSKSPELRHRCLAA
ncbi:putative DNA damage-binding protein 1-like isoform X1 [Capsicum annuum]|nr:putative DNA damage-binding protein 1-like isoform X1 [Capsicum annuum]